MEENGRFRNRNGFTVTGNTLTRDSSVSLKAKGLYLLIMSYITYQNISLTKSFLLKQCKEGKKCFDSTWDELKEAGYLKAYFMPSKKGWKTEYELLDEPSFGAHTFYLNAEGQVSSTNLTREKSNTDNSAFERIPQNGGNADRCPQKGSNAKGIYANGGNNINTTNNIINNYNPSIYIKNKELKKDGKMDESISFSEQNIEDIAMPYSINYDFDNAKETVYALADVDGITSGEEYTSQEKEAYYLAADCLVEMITCKESMFLAGAKVTYVNVIDKINDVVKKDSGHSLCIFLNMTIRDFTEAADKTEIRDLKKYMKVCLWNSFTTYQLKWSLFFNRTYQDVVLAEAKGEC